MSAREAMAIGTAGYTAMLAVMALERHGVAPRTGRCSSPAPRAASARSQLQFFPSVAFRSQPRPGVAEEADYLKNLGASEIIERKELAGPAKPLGKERWAGGIDSVGSTTLANCCR